MTIWIVRKHPPYPLGISYGNLEAFTIFSTHSTRAEAEAVASSKGARAKKQNSRYLYTVGRVTLKEQ
jgi:hypothetical protein